MRSCFVNRVCEERQHGIYKEMVKNVVAPHDNCSVHNDPIVK